MIYVSRNIMALFIMYNWGYMISRVHSEDMFLMNLVLHWGSSLYVAICCNYTGPNLHLSDTLQSKHNKCSHLFHHLSQWTWYIFVCSVLLWWRSFFDGFFGFACLLLCMFVLFWFDSLSLTSFSFFFLSLSNFHCLFSSCAHFFISSFSLSSAKNS